MKKAIIACLIAAACFTTPVAGKLFSGDVLAASEETVSDQEQTIAINENNFPDKIFRKFVAQFDTDQNREFSQAEIDAVKSIKIRSVGVEDLKGIEFFTSLKELDCLDNLLTKIDLSGNTKLEVLDCSYNRLTKLDVSSCPALKTLRFDCNLIKSINTGNLSDLEVLTCCADDLRSLDVSNNTKLRTLTCSDYDYDHEIEPKFGPENPCKNQITSLDLSNCPDLEILDCTGSSMQTLDISKNTNLVELYCGKNEIKILETSDLHKLKNVVAYMNELTKIDLSHCPDLEIVSVLYNGLSELEVDAPNLRELHCENNSLVTLTIGDAPKLENLSCESNSLSVLKLNKTSMLQHFDCASNHILELDLSSCTALEEFYCDNNLLSKLDTSNCPELKAIIAYDNQITKADVTKNTKLDCIDFSDNKLSSLDVSSCPLLEILRVKGNAISSLKLGRNPYIHTLECERTNIDKLDISQLTCIQELIRRYDPEYDPDEKIYIYIGWVPYKPGIEVSGTFIYDEKTKIVGTASGDIADFIERLYNDALGRLSEEAGKKYWVDAIKSGQKTGADCGLFFLLGEEFTNKKMSDGALLDILYPVFFNREPDDEGRTFWLSQLNKGVSREQVIRSFIDSTEWCNICAGYGVKSGAPTAKSEIASNNAVKFATRLFTCCMKREPDTDGLGFWGLALTNLEQTGTSAALYFFESAEFIGFNTTDEDYLTRLYTTFMDRQPDEDGMSFWLGQMKNGKSRHDVLMSFAQSTEFTEICARYGINR